MQWDSINILALAGPIRAVWLTAIHFWKAWRVSAHSVCMP